MLRNSAVAMWIFVLLGLIPFMPFGWGATFLFFVIPVWLVYWQVKFGKLQTSDCRLQTRQARPAHCAGHVATSTGSRTGVFDLAIGIDSLELINRTVFEGHSQEEPVSANG